MIKRDKKIKEVQKEYHWVYPLILGGFLVVLGIVIGAFLFGRDDAVYSGNMLAFATNLWTEGISVALTIFIIDRINKRRDSLENEKEEKERLLLELRSKDNATALNALDKIRQQGWHTDTSLQGVNLWSANLEKGVLNYSYLPDANFAQANLQRATFREATLKNANLSWSFLQNTSFHRCDLSDADLLSSNLEAAKLTLANLEGASLAHTNLEGADLAGANLKNANLVDAKFNRLTILPILTLEQETILFEDGNTKFLATKTWTPETDMSRYTDPNHPDFWQPDWVKKQD